MPGLSAARPQIGFFIEDIDNADRLHTALGDTSPVAFKAEVREAEASNRMLATAKSPNWRVSPPGSPNRRTSMVGRSDGAFERKMQS